jgi:hypothetical protein
MGRSSPARVSAILRMATPMLRSSGCVAASLAATVARSASACSSETPGFSRAIASSPRPPREASNHTRGRAKGVQISINPGRPGSIHSGITSGMTATMA